MSGILAPMIRQAIRHPRRLAVIDDVRRWTYLDLVGGALHLARHLERTTDAAHIGIMLPASGATPMALMATWMLGRVAVPINFLLSESERQFIIEDSDIDTIITAGAMLEFLDAPPQGVQLIELDKLRFKGIPPLRRPRRGRAEDLAAMLYTSGTSGRPKGVQLTHGNLVSNVKAAKQHARITSADGFLGVLPQFHSFGLTAMTLLPLCVGSHAIYTARFVPRKLVELMKQHRPEVFMGVPSMYGALLSVKSAAPDDFKSIRLAVCGGEPLPASLYADVLNRFELEILEGYGLTETSPVVAWSVPWAKANGSVGLPLPGVEVRIVDEQGDGMGAGEEGEVLIKGPNVMRGYHKLPEQTAEVIDADGYFRTGDWGKLDENGMLFITGRKKEMLIIGGENVFPREIEEVLNAHPSVRDSAVIGKQDPVRGELLVAFVELNEDAEFDDASVRAHCREHLAQFKVPREVRVVDALPRNPTGKVLRRELKP